MASKSFVRSVLEYFFAVPMSLSVLGMSFGSDSLGEIVAPLVLKYQTTSGAFWTEWLGDGAKGPREHMFLTFTALVFMPSLIFILWKLVKHRNGGAPVISTGTDLKWFALNCIGTFVLSHALTQKYFGAATSLVLIFLMTTFIVRYSLMPKGNELFVKRFTPPKREGENEFIRKASPWILWALIVIQLQVTIAEFPKVDEGRWFYVVSIAVELWIVILSIFLNNRLPAKVFLICSGIFAVAWFDRNVLDVVRAFGGKWEIS